MNYQSISKYYNNLIVLDCKLFFDIKLIFFNVKKSESLGTHFSVNNFYTIFMSKFFIFQLHG